MLLHLLGVDQKNAEVRDIKKEMKQATTNLVRQTNKLNRIMIEEGVTLDIARATGLKQHGY